MAQNRGLSASTPKKRGRGKPFARGTSGNPGGRPKLPPEVRARAQHFGAEMVDVLRNLAVDTEQTGAVRVAAAIAVLDRGFGKPTATIVAAEVDLCDLILSAMSRRDAEEASGRIVDYQGDYRD